jgi:Zn-dependent peptidase ImmA (M78 family)
MGAIERVFEIVMTKYRGYTVDEICEAEGIEIRSDEMGKGYFGLYTNLYGKAVINVRPDLSLQEMVEVKSHELFHHFCLQLVDNPVGYNLLTELRCASPFLSFYMRKEERDADIFAAYFLCPDVSDCNDYYDIMRKYNRSKPVAKLRMVAEKLRLYGGPGNGFSEEER